MTAIAALINGSFEIARLFGLPRYIGSCRHHGPSVFKWVSNRCCIHCNKAEADKYKIRHAAKLLKSRRDWALANPEKSLLQRARARARERGLPFDINVDDVRVPRCCPVFGAPFVFGEKSDWNPSIDRIDSRRGYTKDNVIVVSFLANRLKSDATIDQMKRMIDFYEQFADR